MLSKPTRAVRVSGSRRSKIITAAKGPQYGNGLTIGLGSIIVAEAAFALEETVLSSGATDLVSVIQDNPVLAGAAALVAFGGVAVASSLRPARTASTAATDAFEALKAEERCVLVDVRPKASLRAEGVVDLRELGKKPLNVVYAERGEEEEGARSLQAVVNPEFAAALQKVEGISETSIIILIDSDGSLAPRAAADLAEVDFFSEKIFWVRGGMEGPKGWKASELPTRPYRVFELPLPALPTLELPTLELPSVELPPLELPSVDLTALATELQSQVPEVDLRDTAERVNRAVGDITDRYRENPSVANGMLAAAGVVAVGAFAVTELDALLQIAGALGLSRFLATRMLFAKDREATLAAVRAFLQEGGFAVPAASSGSASSSSPGSSSGSALQQLADMVLGFREGDSAARQVVDQVAPDIKGVDQKALAAALVAAGFQLPLPPPNRPAAIPATEAPAAAAAPAAVVSAPITSGPAVAAAAAAAADTVTAAAPGAAPQPAQVTAAMGAAEPVETPSPAATVIGLEGEMVVAAVPKAAVVVAGTASAPEAPAADVPPPANVLEVREWIAAWKRRGGEAPVAKVAVAVAADVAIPASPLQVVAVTAKAASKTPEVPPQDSVSGQSTAKVPANVSDARAWIAAWKQRRGSERVAAVGAVAAAEATAAAAVEVTAAAAAVPEAAAAETVLGDSALPQHAEGAESVSTPANVLEVREWIAAWRQLSSKVAEAAAATAAMATADDDAVVPALTQPSPAVTSGSSLGEVVPPPPLPAVEPQGPVATPANVLEARAWIAVWKQRRSSERVTAAGGSTAATNIAAAAEEELPESSASLLDDGVESALAPGNVVAARGWIAAWKQARQAERAQTQARAEQQKAAAVQAKEEDVASERVGVAAVAVVGGDGASDSDPAELPIRLAAGNGMGPAMEVAVEAGERQEAEVANVAA